MRIADKLGKPISETAYLTAENVTRYRAILRFFYLQHERIRYWLDQDEVYEEMKKYEEFKPDIVTMDITMPKLDGIDAVSEILKINPAAKIVMVTAAGQKTNIVEALKRGAADFIQKPFESSAIVSVLEKVMGE